MNISILGCGWLGLPLAKILIEKGHTIKGSTTRREKIIKLQEEQILPYQIQLFAEGIHGDIDAFLSDSEILVLDIPPGLRSDPKADFTGKIKELLDHLTRSSIKNVLFVSSTSVYKDMEEFFVYTETSTPNGNSRAAVEIIAAEKLLTENDKFSTTIVRFGGLLGADRHPVNFLSGRTGIKNPKAPVNLIQQEDCIEIIRKIIEKETWGTTFNAAFPEHPGKESYYAEKAAQNTLAPPEYDHNSPSKGKIVSSERLKELLDFDFQHKI
ncbi:SDR family NAD(P)-dependent oxidoreductase [Zunongwangia sp. F260]|uniref:SDR family NAD(P)-dependent oxidoreductase n=1 Tax=Autumnicola lenta TaxID=3075593 RepID=A0ABU3CI34_9FLAO|nr:SDR family NAD(P)-dependent oxidoreductase [Zunongwangia sp. F260]MDT0645655.1 SDR family NAD(P)-dependent oxidoreductase [Zunongwangia sp. F260]